MADKQSDEHTCVHQACAWCYTRCLELASAYAKQRGTFGRTLADMNLVRFLDLKYPSELAATNPPH
jgi:alkylation response protein AidB-like acyl-CoA dehydrogenase